MGRAIQPEEFALKRKDNAESRRASTASRDLAHYIADMLHSLRTCAKAPDLKSLEAQLRTAEIEARKICGDERDPASQRIDMQPWRDARTGRD